MQHSRYVTFVYHCLETDSMAAIHSDVIVHTDGQSATRALGTVTQHARRKEMPSSVDLGIPQHQWSGCELCGW